MESFKVIEYYQTVRQMLQKPELRQSIAQLLEAEEQFQQNKQQNNHHRAAFNSSQEMISPLEQKFIEARSSEEQEVCRLLLKYVNEG